MRVPHRPRRWPSRPGLGAPRLAAVADTSSSSRRRSRWWWREQPSAALLTPRPLRPSLAAVGSYHDTQAGFSLTYPSSWRLKHATPGTGVQFVVDTTTRVPPGEVATVTLTVGADRGPLPSVADLVRTETADLATQHPDLRVTGSGAATLAAGPALQLQFSDPGTAPPTTVEQVVGRTADDRPLTVTVVIPNPRYGPSRVELDDFLTSVVS